MTANNDGHISVYLVDDHPAIRNAVRDKIEHLIDMEICGETGSAEQALREVEALRPDVCVADISLEDGHGLDLIRNLGAQFPEVQSVIFSMYDEKVYAERALRAGASGYLMKNASTDTLIEAIRCAHDEGVYLSKKMTSRVLGKVREQGNSSPSFPIDDLTDREMSVFQMLGQGYSIEEIQDRLSLARKTIETYRRRAKEKLGFDTVSELLQYAVQWTYGQGSDSEEEEMAEPTVSPSP